MIPDLSQYDADFEDAPVKEHSFDSVPDGKYEAVIDSVTICHSKASGKPMVKWCLKIEGPHYAGRLLWLNQTFETKPTLERLKSNLYLCGLRLGKLSELEARTHELTGVRLAITVKHKDEYENIYLNKLLGAGQSNGGAPPDDFDAPPHTDEDRIPF